MVAELKEFKMKLNREIFKIQSTRWNTFSNLSFTWIDHCCCFYENLSINLCMTFAKRMKKSMNCMVKISPSCYKMDLYALFIMQISSSLIQQYTLTSYAASINTFPLWKDKILWYRRQRYTDSYFLTCCQLRLSLTAHLQRGNIHPIEATCLPRMPTCNALGRKPLGWAVHEPSI